MVPIITFSAWSFSSWPSIWYTPLITLHSQIFIS